MAALSAIASSWVMPALLQGIRAPEGIWPTTVTGWVTLVASVATLIAIPVAYGKWVERMNGLGQRVTDVEHASRLHGAFQQDDAKRRVREETEARHMGERVKALEVTVEAMEKAAHEHHAEQRALILEVGKQQTEALHRLELRVERSAAQNDLGEQMLRVCETIERGFSSLKGER